METPPKQSPPPVEPPPQSPPPANFSRAYIEKDVLKDAYDKVVFFNKVFAVPYRMTWSQVGKDIVDLRANLIEEELQELIDSKNALEELDARCDLMYVALGAMHSFGIAATFLDSPIARVPANYVGAFGIVLEKGLRVWPPCWRTVLWNLPDAILGLTAGSCMKFPLFWKAFNAVHRANMDKLWDSAQFLALSPDQRALLDPYTTADDLSKLLVKRLSDGKVIKPPTFRPPDLSLYT